MRYFFGFLVFILLIIVGLILIFRGSGDKPQTTNKPPVILPLPQYATTNAAVSMTLDGRVNGEDLHRAIRITVNRDVRTVETIQGYSGRVIDSRSQPNNSDAYEVFLRSINNSGFMTRLKNAKVPEDPSGQCPTGFRTIFILEKDTKPLSNLWTSDCGVGNFGGNLDLIQELFRLQITNYEDLTATVEL